MFDGNDDFDLEDDFLNDVFDIEKENVNTQQKVSRVEDTVLNSGSYKSEGHTAGQRFVFNPVSAAGQSSSSASFLRSAFRKNEDVSPCSSKRPDFISTITRKPVTTPVSSSSNTKRQRKFPGPAGLLPDRQNVSFCDAEGTLPVVDSENACDVPMNDLCSQGPCSGSVLQEEPWQQMLADLGSEPPGREVLDMLNIASIKRKGAARLLVGRKVPFLAAVLHHIDVSSADPVVVLRDDTGEMHGTLHRDVWEQFAVELTVGSVLVLRNVGVLSTGMSTRRHYLNITSNNLATIYTASQGEARVSNLRPLTKTDFMKTIEDWQRMVNQTVCNSPGYKSPVPQLFNSVQPMTSSPLSPKLLPTNKLQNNTINIRNLAKAFNNNQYPVSPAIPSCSHNSSSSVNNKNNETFKQTTSGKFIHNSAPNNPVKMNQLSYDNLGKINQLSGANRSKINQSSNNNNNPSKINQLSNNNRSKINQLSNNNLSKINQLSNNNLSEINQLKQIESGNRYFEFSNKNVMSTNMNCSFDQQSVDMFPSRENTQKSQQHTYTSHPNNWMNNLKNNRFNNSSSSNLAAGKSESSSFQPKKPKFSNFMNTSTDENSKQVINLSSSNITICSGRVTEDEKSVVASVLDGLDEDSLFSDDF